MDATSGSPAVSALGPVDALAGQRVVPLGGTKQRAVLARLVVAHPAEVDQDALVDAVWDDSPPVAAASALGAYLSRLRKALGPGVVVRGPGGHRLELPEQRADWLRFAAALDLARRAHAGGRPAEVASLLEPALATWRGPRPLAPFTGAPWAQAWVAALEEDRYRAVCLLGEAQLAVGAFDQALGTLAPVLATSFDDTPVALAMRAHHAAGRSSESLEVFDRHRARLADELGLDPSPLLRDLQVGILRRSPSVAWRPAVQPEAPRLLPPPPRRLVGRENAVRHVLGLLEADRCVALAGLAGVGKTSIAAEVAHEFPGPVCWVPAGEETSSLGTLTELAFRLGLPRGLGRRELLAMIWERLDDGAPWLLVLDGAPSPDDVRWLLPPPWSHGLVLVTSLDPTWNREGTCLRVDPLRRAAATSFVLRRSGRPGIDDDPSVAGARAGEEAALLADELGGLPLALEQACTYMSQTGMGAGAYLRLFRAKRDHLLARGAPASHPHPAATTWQLLFDAVRQRAPVAAELLEVASFLSPDGVAWSLLDGQGGPSAEAQLLRLDAVLELVRCSLVDRDDTELRVHRLVQGVVRDRMAPGARSARAAAATMALLAAAPAEPDVPASWETWSQLLPHLESLVRACADVAVAPAGIVALVGRFVAYLRYRSGLLHAESLVDATLDLFDRTGDDPTAVAVLHALRSEVRDDLGRLDDARSDIMTALALVGPVGPGRPDLDTALTWARLAHVLNCADEGAAAVDLYERSVEVLGAEGERSDVVGALVGLAYTHWGLNEYGAAETRCREALALLEDAGQHGHPLYPAVISALGMMLHEQGRWTQARELQLTALQLLRRLHGDREHHDTAYVHDKLGYVEGLLGHHEESWAAHERAGSILAHLFGDRDPRRAVTVSNRGLAEAALGRPEAAHASQQEAFDLLVVAFGPRHRLTRLVAERLRTAEEQLTARP